MQIKKNIPNFLTCCNLFLGCLAVTYAFKPETLGIAAVLTLLATLFDFADGFSARLLQAHSELGKELDSLADLVTFGVSPGMILFQLYNKNAVPEMAFTLECFYAYLPLCIPVFAAIRLAKFNIDPRQSTYFIGLPTPANAIFIASFPFIAQGKQYYLHPHINSQWMIPAVSIFLSALMISNIPLFSMKVKSLAWQGNEMRYILVLISAFWVAWVGIAGLPLIILTYLVLSAVKILILKQQP